jgi:uncharacterized membrane protein YkoI
MKTLTVLNVALCALGLSAVLAAETKVKMTDLPTPVQQTVKEQTKDATLVGITKEKEKGKTVYEVETKANGKGRDIHIDETGAVIELEQEVEIDSIPPAAKAAIEKKAAGRKIIKVETLTKEGKTTYEAAVKRMWKNAEIRVAADGSPVK